MSRKHAELEREFIEDLEPRTGRALAGWMTLIDETGLTDRNAIIDWLRPQGLTFAHASWLERIHHNGGRPIYADAPERAQQPASQPPAVPAPAPRPSPASAPAPIPAPRAMPVVQPSPATRPAASLQQRAATVPQPPATMPHVSVADLLARGKGLRPLAEMLLREIEQSLPGLVTAPAGDLVSLQRQSEFGVLLIGPRELRLGLDLGEFPTEGPVSRSRIPGTTARITHMLVINDARQIGPPLIELVKRAAAGANPAT